MLARFSMARFSRARFSLDQSSAATGGPRARRALATVSALAAGVGLLGTAGSSVQALAAPATVQASPVLPASGMLNAVLPLRILDTRTTTGGHHAKLGSGATMTLQVVSAGGVPDGGVSAVMVNVTAVNETSRAGYLTLFPTGMSRPLSSTLNYTGGAAVANQALVRVGSDGTISIFNSSGQTDMVVDVEGWVGTDAAPASGQTTTAQPARLLDTRTANGGHNAPLASGQSLTLQVAGVDGVPAAGVSAVWANVTAVPVGTASGYLTAYPSGSAAPLSSTVSFMPGVATATLVLLPLSAGGAITITNHSASANVLVDVAGWTSGGVATADAGITPVPPVRVLDTRTTTGGHEAPVGGGATVSAKVLGIGGVPSTGVAAVVVHVTGTGPTLGTYLQAFGTGNPKRSSSTLNLAKGSTVSNDAIVPVGPDGAVSVYSEQGSLNVVIDVQGWIAAPVLTVVPPLASALSAGPLTSASGQQALTILNNANRYAVTTWRNTIYPALVAAPMHSQILPDDVPALSVSAASVNTGDNTRRLCMEAYSLAVSIATGAYNPAKSGNVSTQAATSFTVQIINKVVGTHLANMASGWGASSESTFYAAYIGTAAWLLWQDLSPAVQSQAAKMVYFEAEWGMDHPMQYYANAAGTVVSPGNTGADGDSWMPMAAQLAIAMMPGNAHAPLWRNAVVREGLVSWARPGDLKNGTAVNGASVASWIGNAGSNVLANGSLINHNRIAPDYSTLIYQNMQDILVSALAGQPAPQAVTTLVGPVYTSFTTAKFASPPWDSPGGTVYQPGKEAVYWPQGCDWGEGQYLPFALVDAETAAFGAVNPATDGNATYENLHAKGELALQAKNADGSSYNASTNPTYVYAGREEHAAQLAAQLYLTMFVRDHSLFSFSNSSDWLAP
jgi:hypothetical protein